MQQVNIVQKLPSENMFSEGNFLQINFIAIVTSDMAGYPQCMHAGPRLRSRPGHSIHDRCGAHPHRKSQK